MPSDAHVVVATDHFSDDLAALTERLGFRVDVIHPADDPAVAVVSGHGTRLRLEASDHSSPIVLDLLTDEPADDVTLAGGTVVRSRPRTCEMELPDNRPSLVITHDDGASGIGRAGMRYRDLVPDRWGGRFIASHITIPEGGEVPDYVHFHKIRFQLIFVAAGWVRLVYEDQGDPFVLTAGDCVLQPPEIRHRVLESSPGLEVIEIGCPAEHETIADWALPLPTPDVRAHRDFGGQRFVRHVAAGSSHAPWRLVGWEFRDTGIGLATDGLAGVRVARPVHVGSPSSEGPWIRHDTEYAQLVVLSGGVTFETPDGRCERLERGSSAAIPGGTPHRLVDATADCELLDVTLPDTFAVVVHTC